MSSEPTIRASIKSAMQGVSNIGLVYDYLRFAAEWDTFLDLFKTTISGTPQIRGWMITCNGFNPGQARETYGNSGFLNRDYQYKIFGYMGLDDSAATEKTFFALAEAVIDALDTHLTGGLDNMPTLSTFEPRTFGGLVCHFAEITLIVNQEVGP